MRNSGVATAVVGGLTFGIIPGVGRADTAPVWVQIPEQSWTVGAPVFLDLADYCSDPEGKALVFALNGQLPAGVTMEGSIIRGSPVSASPAVELVATADDMVVAPKSPTGLGAT